MSIKNIDSLLEKLEENVPDVYIHCVASVPNKAGRTVQKKCTLNLSTGDVFPRRKLEKNELSNYRILRSHQRPVNGAPAMTHRAYRNAQIIDDKIVLTTWIFGDHINCPGTNAISDWYGDVSIDGAKRGEVRDSNALFNIVLSEPKVAAIVTVSADKKVGTWEDLDKYGFEKSRNDSYYHESWYLTRALHESLCSAYETKDVCNLTECFKEFFGIGYAGANKYLNFDSHKDVALFMRATTMEKKNSKMQTVVDELTSIALPDHSIVAESDNIVCYADRVNDEWTALRWWMRKAPAQYYETSRLYVNKTQAIQCRSNLSGEWVYASAKLKATTFNADKVILQSDTCLDGTKLEYFKNISAEMSNQSAALYMLTMYPEFEKMYKSGLGWLCDNYLKSQYQESWKNYLSGHLGAYDADAKNVFKMVGLNRHQIDSVAAFRARITHGMSESYWATHYVNHIIWKMKQVFGTDTLNSIDDATFDYILDSVNADRLVGTYMNALQFTFELYPKDAMYFIRDLNAIADDGRTNVSYATRWGHRASMSVDRLYFDTIQMIRSGSYMDVIRPRFSSVDELYNHHQVMVDLVNADAIKHEARVQAQYADGFKTNLERWKKWEWSEDETFCVIAPKAPVDVAVEGITLRHCVKSYIPLVSQGGTNVMFIRRKGKEEEPFFTVEVDNTNHIRQVHGMCNCNANTVDGLIEFVAKWSKLKKLKYNETHANGVRAAG